MKRQFNRLLRWLLFLWVQVEAFPHPRPDEAIDSDGPTLYVLADRGLSDLLVLQTVCAEHRMPDPLAKLGLQRYPSVYSVASRSPVTDWVRRRRKQSPMLKDLVCALADDRDRELQIVPVSVFWGRPLSRNKHWLQVLFADTWAIGSRARRFFTVLIHGRNTRLIFSPALKLRALLDACDYREDALQETLVNLLHQQREATFGPQITSHRQMTASVVDDPPVQRQIAEESIPAVTARRRAERYCDEIFADCTQLTIEIMLRLLRAFWHRFYSGIDVRNVDRIRKMALDHQLVYVPCHRSHVDYLLMSYVIYDENLAIPYIAAGDNLNVPFIGRILRGGGAFFIRRSFRDNRLYSAVMRSYVLHLVKLGVPLEFFVEGGRSRTGRMLKPRYGMLDMTVDAWIRTRERPLAFVPVYIGYEKLIEGKSYLGELYGGRKRRESTLGALGAIFRLKGHFGRVTASFGEPIVLADLLARQHPDWESRVSEIDAKPAWYKTSLQSLGAEIMQGIGRACVINPVNTVASVLLATPRQSIEIDELIQQCALHSRLVRRTPCLSTIRIEAEVDRAQIDHLVKQKIVHLRQHELGDIVYLEPEDAVMLGYYRNNSLHCLVIAALIACCFSNLRRLSRDSLHGKIALLYPFLKSELQLEWSDESLPDIVTQFIDGLVDEGLLQVRDAHLQRPSRSDHAFLELMRLGQIVQPILERYYMTFILLWQSSDAPPNEKQLEHRCHMLAQKISMIYGINAPDFFDRLLFRDFISTLHDQGYLQNDDEGKLVFEPDSDFVRLDLRNLLSTEVRSSILSIVKTSPH